ncbi:uncharacterized protein AB675_5458 [Cyphellophora attinorum]|uniref:Uncharacterized protein n=1 Tax=Cyphellophora attinorum TaxID=1664694 RepID=A0A0N0NP66_9EURO|nr:uncharacterized protein AB675_5458 [Phialophora attinorum]KPI42179.1 hypothetical protein AB675_5458 [Phialophora attinorum]
MASAAVDQSAGGHTTTFEPLTTVQTGVTKHHVRTILNYHKPNEDGSPPHATYVGRPETYERPVDPVEVTINDIRGETDKYNLDSNGFQLYNFPSAEKDFLDDDKIKAEYYPETERLLKEATGASRVFIFDHTIRRPGPPSAENPTENTPAAPLRGPVQRVHIDQSYTASRSRVPHHLPELADQLLRPATRSSTSGAPSSHLQGSSRCGRRTLRARY